MKNKELKEYLQTLISQSENRAKGMTMDANGNPLFKRNVFFELNDIVNSFLKKGTDPRIIVMPGLRGTGKTTLLSQLYLSLKENSKLYISIEEAVRRFNVNLWDIIEAYEEIIGKRLEELDEPLIIFLDEIHYDENWSIFLKTLYDKSKKVIVFATGSSSLLLREQVNADSARRTYFIDIHPVSFSEYMLFKYGKKEIDFNIKEAILSSNNAKQCFERIKNNEDKIKKYLSGVDKLEIENYVKIGTFPFSLNLKNENIAINFISQIINKVIYIDVPQFYNFDKETINKIDKILYLLSDTLGVSVNKLSSIIEMNKETVSSVLRSLESSGLLLKIPANGSHFKQIKKPSKYLFSTPSLRFSYLSSRESVVSISNYKGALLEDVVAMYLNRIIPKYGEYFLTYDVSENGADFILSYGDKKIVIEVGSGQKNCKQILETNKKINPSYGLIISNDELELIEEYNLIKIPLNYFLLS